MLIVAAPDAPATRTLPSAVREAAAVHRLLPQAVRPSRPTRASVLEALPGQALVHFSCHGIADPRNPADSHLVLYDDPPDPLTVGDVSALRVSAELAYLSACDTTVTTALLSNEAVHLTGAFHLAGYRHVIGSLWQVGDSAARRLATDFYDRLTAGGTTAPDTGRSAHALREAVRKLRARHPDTPTLWAAHHHTGA
jgi:CHAT domain-containing protein